MVLYLCIGHGCILRALCFDFHHCQLLRFQFGREIILFNFPNYVCAFHWLFSKIDCIVKIMIFFQRSFPDWRTPSGYAVQWLSEASGSTALFFAFPPVLCVVCASCWFFMTIADDDLIQEMATFNNAFKTTDEKDYKELMRRFCDIIQLDWDAKE